MILKNVGAVDSIVFDAMAIVQMIKPPPYPVVSTYNDMALIFWKYTEPI